MKRKPPAHRYSSLRDCIQGKAWQDAGMIRKGVATLVWHGAWLDILEKVREDVGESVVGMFRGQIMGVWGGARGMVLDALLRDEV